MASASRKRRASRSPSRSSPAKSTRRQSASISIEPRHRTTESQLSRAKSVFRGQRDPYFPLNGGGVTLSTGDDYVFRVQVVSTTADLETEVFKKAVQGLVKICFPQNILEELGIDIVTQHMRNERAPQQNIAKMSDIFRSEMIHRVTWMLAEYLDSPSRVEASVKAIMAASASLHGATIGEDVLDDVVRSLAKLKREIPNASTAQLATMTDLSASHDYVVPSHVADSDAECCTVVVSKLPTEGNLASLPPQSPKMKQNLKPTLQLQSRCLASEETHESPPQSSWHAPERVKPSREGKESRISTSWRWDVQDDISFGNLAHHFKRTSDLFAYHALPIARHRVGPQAKRKQVRQEIEMMLAATPGDEFEKWVESFSKLGRGDLSMLERNSAGHRGQQQRDFPSTAAPVIRQSETRSIAQSPPVYPPSKSNRLESSRPGNQSLIKRERDNNPSDLDAQPPPLRVTRKDRDAATARTGARMGRTNPADEGTKSSDRTGHRTYADVTPIVDLLWGMHRFGEHDRAAVAHAIMSQLDSRVATVKSIGVTRFDGTTLVQTKKELEMMLLKVEANTPPTFSGDRPRLVMERQLQPWVLSNLASFPELTASKFVFVNITPNLSTAADLFFDPKELLTELSMEAIRSRLVEGLKARKIFTGHVAEEVTRALSNVRRCDTHMRGIVEKVLRRIAFAQRARFPELQFSTLVKTWQRATKQIW